MILLIAAALAAAAPGADACPTDNSVQSLTCRAVMNHSEGRHVQSAEAFEQLAAALPETDPTRDRALAAAGNMWIAAGEPGKAALALDRAIAGTGLQAEQRGEALLDRARAAEAQNDLKTARAKATEAAFTIAEDPFLWYFSAALAIREEDAATARSAINKALSLAPGDPTLLFQAGHVAHFAGNAQAARDYWSRASTADPSGKSGDAARAALKLLDAPVQIGAQAPK